MFDLENLLIWGIPWLGVSRAFLDFLAWAGLKISEKVDTSIFAALGVVGFLLSQNMEALYALWPPLETYGPMALGAVVVFLALGGHYKLQARVRAFLK